MDQQSSGPAHHESNLLDCPDYWIDEADQVIDALRLEIQILKNENDKLKFELGKHQSVLVSLGLEIEKLVVENIKTP